MNITGTISGKWLSHRKLTKPQLGALGANIRDKLVDVNWSTRQIAAALGVSVRYIKLARGLSPEVRKAILAGSNSTNFTALNGSRKPAALPAPTNGFTHIDDVTLFEIARAAGADRTLNAAVAAEKQTAA